MATNQLTYYVYIINFILRMEMQIWIKSILNFPKETVKPHVKELRKIFIKKIAL